MLSASSADHEHLDVELHAGADNGNDLIFITPNIRAYSDDYPAVRDGRQALLMWHANLCSHSAISLRGNVTLAKRESRLSIYESPTPRN